MSTLTINTSSFTPSGVSQYGDEVGTVEVSGKVCRATRSKYGIQVHGYVGRYRTSPIAWIASVSASERGISVNFGRDDRCGRFNKQDAISYEPELFDTLTNAKVWDAI